MRKKIYEYNSFNEYKENNTTLFKHHIASFEKLPNGNDCIVTFENPDTKCGAMKFVYVDGVLHVQGDYGYASFNWYNKRNHILVYGTFSSFGYVLSKLVSVKEDDLYGWDYNLFNKDFKKLIEDRLNCGYEIDEEYREIPNCESLTDVISYFSDNYDNYGEDLHETGAYTLGRYVNERPYIWWFGLHSALKQLEEKGLFDE